MSKIPHDVSPVSNDLKFLQSAKAMVLHNVLLLTQSVLDFNLEGKEGHGTSQEPASQKRVTQYGK